MQMVNTPSEAVFTLELQESSREGLRLSCILCFLLILWYTWLHSASDLLGVSSGFVTNLYKAQKVGPVREWPSVV